MFYKKHIARNICRAFTKIEKMFEKVASQATEIVNNLQHLPLGQLATLSQWNFQGLETGKKYKSGQIVFSTHVHFPKETDALPAFGMSQPESMSVLPIFVKVTSFQLAYCLANFI